MLYAGPHRLTPYTIIPAIDGRCYWYPPPSPLLGWYISSLLLGGWFLTAHCTFLWRTVPGLRGVTVPQGAGMYCACPPLKLAHLPHWKQPLTPLLPPPFTPDKEQAKDGFYLRLHPAWLFSPTSSCFPRPLTGFSEQDFLNKPDRLETMSQAVLRGNSTQDTASAFTNAPLLESVFIAPSPWGFCPHHSHILDLYPVPH